MSLIDKVKAFLRLKKKKQREDVEALEKIIASLVAKAKGLKKRYEEELDRKKKEKRLKEFKAVKKLLKKSRKRLRKIRAEE